MKLDFFDWLTIILALHCDVAWYCDFQYEASRTWAIVATALFGSHLLILAMMCVMFYALLGGVIGTIASKIGKKGL